ncbi:MAG: hypothetical protein KatS3mg103_1273 [Phycisphaerales bacterium]|nr:MAG: hypothetical protein KatS3mg103_1273 [Phycisphaerales bacterium]
MPPGQTTDPFQLGNGPFPPLPIGHRAQDILDRYRVELVPWDQGLTPDPDLDPRYPDEKLQIDMAQALMDFARGSVQLRLVPRADDARFREIRLWYRPDAQGVLLPRMSRTVDATTGNVFIVQLMHPLTINEPPREDLLTITPTDQDPNNPWSIIEHRLSDQPDAQSQGSAPAGTTRTDTPERP